MPKSALFDFIFCGSTSRFLTFCQALTSVRANRTSRGRVERRAQTRERRLVDQQGAAHFCASDYRTSLRTIRVCIRPVGVHIRVWPIGVRIRVGIGHRRAGRHRGRCRHCICTIGIISDRICIRGSAAGHAQSSQGKQTHCCKRFFHLNQFSCLRQRSVGM